MIDTDPADSLWALLTLAAVAVLTLAAAVVFLWWVSKP